MAKEKIYTHMAIPIALKKPFGEIKCPANVLKAGD